MFLDGVGIGEKDPGKNPFFRAAIPVLTSLCDGDLPHMPFRNRSARNAEVLSVNATLGMPGLPQSGTGQTALFTGVNGAKKFGRHFGPYPPSILRDSIAEKNIFRRVHAVGRSAVFANAYPRRFFEYIESGVRRLTVTTLSCRFAGVPLLTARELERDEAVSPDLIRAYWHELGHTDVRTVTPREAGTHLHQISSRSDFTLFEYWLTDHAGHAQKMDQAVESLERFDAFLGGFLESFDKQTSLLIITSDHGNVEDLSTKSHTRNRVPCILVGKGRAEAALKIKSLTQITPVIVDLFRKT